MAPTFWTNFFQASPTVLKAESFLGGTRSASARAPNGTHSSAGTSGPFRPAVTLHARPSRTYPAGRHQNTGQRAHDREGRRGREAEPAGGAMLRSCGRSWFSPLVGAATPIDLSAPAVLVVAAPPERRLVASLGCAVRPLVHAPEGRPLRAHRWNRCGRGRPSSSANALMPGRSRMYAATSVPAMAARRGALGEGFRLRVQHVAAALVVYSTPPARCLLRGDRNVEVEVEVAAERGRPGNVNPSAACTPAASRAAPATPPKRDIVVRQVDDGAVEAISDRRAGRATGLAVRSEHEVVDEELQAPSEQVLNKALPSSVSDRYALSIRTHGSCCRRRASSSLRRVSSFSSLSSSSRAANHSSRVPVMYFVTYFSPFGVPSSS